MRSSPLDHQLPADLPVRHKHVTVVPPYPCFAVLLFHGHVVYLVRNLHAAVAAVSGCSFA